MQAPRLCAVILATFVLSGCPEPKEPPHLLYEQDAQSLDNPFPDLRLVSSRGFEVRPDWYKPFLMPKAATARMLEFFAAYGASAVQVKGDGNFGPTLLRVSEAVEPSALAVIAFLVTWASMGLIQVFGRHASAMRADLGKDD